MPYPLFAYIGLLPWGFFSSSVSSGGTSILSNGSLMNKVYCPREVFPLYNIVVAGVDMAVSGIVLVLLFVIFGFAPKPTSFWVPVALLGATRVHRGRGARSSRRRSCTCGTCAR